MLRIAIMVSGNGTLMQHVCDTANNGQIDATIQVVIYSKDCKAQQLAIDNNLPCFAYDENFESILEEYKVDLIILAGYTKRLIVPELYRNQIINIHPSLLPKFGGKGMYGMRVHEAVLESNEKTTGCTVHLVNDEYDSGMILLQKECEVLPQDNPAVLRQRVFELEKDLIIEAIQQFQD